MKTNPKCFASNVTSGINMSTKVWFRKGVGIIPEPSVEKSK